MRLVCCPSWEIPSTDGAYVVVFIDRILLVASAITNVEVSCIDTPIDVSKLVFRLAVFGATMSDRLVGHLGK